jgi:uncharacterized phiE125 gp8 family phage protein
MSNVYNVVTITPPASEVLTLDEVKTHLKVDYTDDDDLINGLIVAAREYAEKFCNRKFISQTLRLSIDNFYDWYSVDNSLSVPWYQFLRIPYPPVTSVTQIQYKDVSGNWQTLSSSIYQTDLISEPARIYHAYNQGFPIVQQVPQAIQITFVAGYANSAAVPSSIKAGMKLLIGHWYDNRAIYTDTRLAELPLSAESLLSMNRILDI